MLLATKSSEGAVSTSTPTGNVALLAELGLCVGCVTKRKGTVGQDASGRTEEHAHGCKRQEGTEDAFQTRQESSVIQEGQAGSGRGRRVIVYNRDKHEGTLRQQCWFFLTVLTLTKVTVVKLSGSAASSSNSTSTTNNRVVAWLIRGAAGNSHWPCPLGLADQQWRSR